MKPGARYLKCWVDPSDPELRQSALNNPKISQFVIIAGRAALSMTTLLCRVSRCLCVSNTAQSSKDGDESNKKARHECKYNIWRAISEGPGCSAHNPPQSTSSHRDRFYDFKSRKADFLGELARVANLSPSIFPIFLRLESACRRGNI